MRDLDLFFCLKLFNIEVPSRFSKPRGRRWDWMEMREKTSIPSIGRLWLDVSMQYFDGLLLVPRLRPLKHFLWREVPCMPFLTDIYRCANETYIRILVFSLHAELVIFFQKLLRYWCITSCFPSTVLSCLASCVLEGPFIMSVERTPLLDSKGSMNIPPG